MLREYNQYRSFSDNIKLGALTAFSAGMVNVVSVIVFFAFTSNVTGHYAILAQEISKGNWYQAGVVFIWISLFMFGNFVSNLSVIHSKTKVGHFVPLILEISCLAVCGYYLTNHYSDTLPETEVIVGSLLFSMGLQNGLTASISNFSIKTTHLTGLTTDLGILLSMFTKKSNRENKALREKAAILFAIMFSYLGGGVFSGVIYNGIGYPVFYVVCCVLGTVLVYDHITGLKQKRKQVKPVFRHVIVNSSDEQKINQSNTLSTGAKEPEKEFSS